MTPTATTKRVWLGKLERFAHFTPRQRMARRHSARSVMNGTVPATTLPVDGTNDAQVACPMLGNDQYGDCGPVMCAHVHGIWTYGQGKHTEDVIAQAPLVAQYLKISGGDNGTDETMLVGPQGIWTPAGGGIGNDTNAVIADSLDVPNSPALLQYCIDQFYAVEMAWSVPDAFLDQFQTGASFLQPMVPNPDHGHYTPLADVDAGGNYRLWTWGGWCWVSQAFVSSVDPVFFVAFSPRQFDPATGLDSKGRHVTQQASRWVALGGSAGKAAAVVAMFPPAPVGPPPVPPTPLSFQLRLNRPVRQGGLVVFRSPLPLPAGDYAVTADGGRGIYSTVLRTEQED